MSKGSWLKGVKGNSTAKKGVASENDGAVFRCNRRHPPLPPTHISFLFAPSPKKTMGAPKKIHVQCGLPPRLCARSDANVSPGEQSSQGQTSPQLPKLLGWRLESSAGVSVPPSSPAETSLPKWPQSQGKAAMHACCLSDTTLRTATACM